MMKLFVFFLILALASAKLAVPQSRECKYSKGLILWTTELWKRLFRLVRFSNSCLLLHSAHEEEVCQVQVQQEWQDWQVYVYY